MELSPTNDKGSAVCAAGRQLRNVPQSIAILMKNQAILFDRNPSISGESQVDQISTNFNRTLLIFSSKSDRISYSSAQHLDRNSIPSGDRNFGRNLIDFGSWNQGLGNPKVQGSCLNLDLDVYNGASA